MSGNSRQRFDPARFEKDIHLEAHNRSMRSASFHPFITYFLRGERQASRSVATSSRLWPEWAALVLYAGLVAFAIPYHEPWADEAQSWQLARSLSLSELFGTYIRYEGTPGLWHFLLWVLIRLHVSYVGLHWICGAIGTAATAVLLFKSPFPRYLKLALPFTYFLLFQYAVVARSYVLAPILLYLVAVFWKRNPVAVAVLLGLLTNVALHAAVISSGLTVVYGVEQVRNLRGQSTRQLRSLVMTAFILLAFAAFALWTAWPPKDLANHMALVQGVSRPVLLSAMRSVLWGISPNWLLSFGFWIVFMLFLRVRRRLYCLLPVLFFAAFCGVVHFEWWHIGLLMPLLICAAWITWPASDTKIGLIETSGRVALLVIAVTQILWSAYVLKFDHYDAYSADLVTSTFLQPYVHEHATIAVTYLIDPDSAAVHVPENFLYNVVGILPYFDRNIFLNLPHPYWSWRRGNLPEDIFKNVLVTHPSLIIAETSTPHSDVQVNWSDPKAELLSKNGYQLTHSYCGNFPRGFQMSEWRCHLIFEPH